MDPRNSTERSEPPGLEPIEPDAIEFVRFCYRRRRVGWPELYDEMCAVAGRGLYRGYSSDDLGRIGIGLTLFEMPGLALMVHRVVSEDQERRRLSSQALRASYAASEPPPVPAVPAAPAAPAPIAAAADPEPTEAPMKLVARPAGA
jgi:hypothetical protein